MRKSIGSLARAFMITGFVSACDTASSDTSPSPDQRPADEAATERQAFVVPADGGPAVWFLGNLGRVKSTIDESGAPWGAIVISAPAGFAPPPHIHLREDESFYVLEGSLSFTAGDQAFDAPAGTFVFAPMGVPHGFVVTSDSTAKWLLIHGPTGDFLRFMSEVGGPAGEPPWPPAGAQRTPAEIAEIARKHYIEPLPPPAP